MELTMRVNIFLKSSNAKVRVGGTIGDGTDGDRRFISVDLDDLTLFFDGYGEANAQAAIDLGGKLIKAALEMRSNALEVTETQ
jgi:hypothetical protein